mgnify:FL=1
MITLKAPLEIGLCVCAPEMMIGFYRDVLGFELISDLKVSLEKSRPTGFTKDGYRIIRLQTNHGERIKLVHPYSIPKKRTFEEEVLSHRGNVFMTFIVEDLKSILKKIRSKVTIFRTEGEIVEVRKGVYLSIIDDPEGNHIELVEYLNLEEYRSDLKLT